MASLTALTESQENLRLTCLSEHRENETDFVVLAAPPVKQDQITQNLEACYIELKSSPTSNSLLKKHLTPERFQRLKNRKTSKGASLFDVAKSGFKNHDSFIGIYAPDPEAYKVFADLFDAVIEDYHSCKLFRNFQPTPDFGNPDSFLNVDPTEEFIISTRIRCGRNLKDYPFNPYMTEIQYQKIEHEVTSALKSLTGGLNGIYYPISEMTKHDKQQLIDEHYLFKEGDRFLQAAGACRYWPVGRGIFLNSTKKFLVWVNEEDHLRIISMQSGGDLRDVYARLVNALQTIQETLSFSHDDRLGFLTFCPTNLGTTIRASVHIKLPKLSTNRELLDRLATKFHLQVRGTNGEHTEGLGGVYDISNKRRLGLTEYESVQEMQKGVIELIKIEKSL